MIMGLTGAVILAMLQLLSLTVSYPWHASCKVDWTTNLPCSEARQKLVSQFQDWSNADCPGVSDTCPSLPCGQRCKYTLIEDTAVAIKGEHRTPVKDYVDDLSFKLADTETGGCKLEGFSTSRIWYAILDQGTNYCNLWNLVDGSGLTKADGFQEETSTSVCTQYDAIDCSRY
eukprot:maker-scaffold23_size669530-snap-gene-1.28 protein:Tk11059 transcript:maker-scaffold23_size669530-snap-gene-1.28-mRNA-1 annotation:"hypothetical protein CGI_10007639"